MSPRSTLQVPRARDLSRLAFARASSRLALGRGPIDAVARVDVLHREIAAAVRLVSPLLLALIDGWGFSVADLVEHMVPAPGWPAGPSLPAYLSFIESARAAAGHGAAPSWVDETWLHGGKRPPFHGACIILPGRSEMHVCVVDHSIEVATRIDTCWLVTLFGTLSVRLAAGHPIRSVARRGSRLEDVLDLPAFLRRGWIVDGVAPGDDQWGMKLAVRTGTVQCRLAGRP